MDEAIRAEYARQAAKLSTSAFWKAKSGQNQIRLLPKPPGETDPAHPMCMTEIRTHFSVGPDSKATPCNGLVGQACAVCEFIEAQVNAGNAEAVEPMQPSTQFNFHILDLATFDPNAAEYPAQIYSATPKQTQDIIGFFVDPEWGDVTDPHTGKACVVDKVEKGRNTRYNIRFGPTPYPIDLNRVKYAKPRAYDSYEDQKAMLAYEHMRTDLPVASPQVAAPVPAAVPVPTAMSPAPVPQVAAPVPAAVPVPAQAITAPPPTAAPPVALPPPPIQPELKYWVAKPDNTVVEMLTSEIKIHMTQNNLAPDAFHLMNYDKSGGWKTAAELGFGM